MKDWKRREFLSATTGGLSLGAMISGLGSLTAADVQFNDNIARFPGDIEPLVQLLEESPRESVIEEVARRVQAGLSYRELLAALLLAGVRNVQPRPSVGFKFHAVLVVNSAHLASQASANEERWLPIFWAIDNFKSSQARDVREGNWTMSPVDEAAIPNASQAASRLRDALNKWDESAADVAIASMVRHHGANRVFEELAAFAARDFRSIGHKVIYLSNAFRTLQTIGWDYAEPVMRSLVYAMLNHTGDPNPSTSDLAADQPGRFNRQRVAEISPNWLDGRADDTATRDLIRTLHTCTPDEASRAVVDLLGSGIHLQSIWDGIFCSAGELLMRQRGIVALHSVTTTNAIYHAFKTTANDETRRYLLLQNASFLPMFRDAAQDRGDLADTHIDEISVSDNAANVADIFQTMGKDRNLGARMAYRFLTDGGNPQSVVSQARRLVFLKGNDSHDYKFSSAALEDYRALSPAWRNRFIAAATFQLRNSTEPTRALVTRIESALA
ncbi:MAG: hypothetical protein GY904_27100 [Planctomycetaceae bacterium]|nr:hypothetical protein [Planctomycetaceae bacterium]